MSKCAHFYVDNFSLHQNHSCYNVRQYCYITKEGLFLRTGVVMRGSHHQPVQTRDLLKVSGPILHGHFTPHRERLFLVDGRGLLIGGDRATALLCLVCMVSLSFTAMALASASSNKTWLSPLSLLSRNQVTSVAVRPSSMRTVTRRHRLADVVCVAR